VPWPLRLRGTNVFNPSTSFYSFGYSGEILAPFANVQWSVNDKLSVGLAARYDREMRAATAGGPDVPNPFLGGASYNPCVRSTGYTGETWWDVQNTPTTLRDPYTLLSALRTRRCSCSCFPRCSSPASPTGSTCIRRSGRRASTVAIRISPWRPMGRRSHVPRLIDPDRSRRAARRRASHAAADVC
jgi:hypothetical protein